MASNSLGYWAWRGGLIAGKAFVTAGRAVHGFGSDIELTAAIGHERYVLLSRGIWCKPLWLAGLEVGRFFRFIGRTTLGIGYGAERWAVGHWRPSYTLRWCKK